jgi:ATP-dependent Clp protease ATP-binding subunit ClpB
VDDKLRRTIELELKQAFKPEFLNRLDEIVLFQSLRKEDIEQIVELQLARLRKRLTERSVTLDLTLAARAFLAERGYDPAFGARPLKRAIQQFVENELAKRLIAGEIVQGSEVAVDVAEGGEKLAMVANRVH